MGLGIKYWQTEDNMPYEVLPEGPDTPALTPFQELIRDQIATRGNDNIAPADRFAPHQTQPDTSFDYQYSHNGEVAFGGNWQTHHLDLEDLQVVYAFKPRTIFRQDPLFASLGKPDTSDKPPSILPAKADFFAYEFGNKGADARTYFSEHQNKLFKARVTAFDEVGGLGYVELHRTLKASEAERLMAVVAAPEEHVVALRGLVNLSRVEGYMAARALKAQRKRERQYQKDMERLSQTAHMPHRIGR
jgi:hypothetical protein